jgi:hypothetical protein
MRTTPAFPWKYHSWEEYGMHKFVNRGLNKTTAREKPNSLIPKTPQFPSEPPHRKVLKKVIPVHKDSTPVLACRQA